MKQFSGSDVRIYRQSTKLEGDISLTEFVENFQGFERREGPITVDKIFRDIWESGGNKMACEVVKPRKKKIAKTKKVYLA